MLGFNNMNMLVRGPRPKPLSQKETLFINLFPGFLSKNHRFTFMLYTNVLGVYLISGSGFGSRGILFT